LAPFAAYEHAGAAAGAAHQAALASVEIGARARLARTSAADAASEVHTPADERGHAQAHAGDERAGRGGGEPVVEAIDEGVDIEPQRRLGRARGCGAADPA